MKLRKAKAGFSFWKNRSIRRVSDESKDSPGNVEGRETMEQETGFELESLHQVRGVLEVQVEPANELLEAGWILHEIFLTQDFESRFILLRVQDSFCPQCGGIARVESVDNGARVRFICQNECH